MKLTPKRKFFSTILIFSLMVALVAVSYIFIYQHIQALVAELKAVDIKIATQRKQQQQIGALIALLRDHGSDFDRPAALSISRANPAPFFQKFEALAANTHTTMIINLRDGAGTASDRMTFQFAITGTEANVTALLALIEHAPYELTIDDFSIQKNEGRGQIGPHTAADSQSATPASAIHLVINVHVKATP